MLLHIHFDAASRPEQTGGREGNIFFRRLATLTPNATRASQCVFGILLLLGRNTTISDVATESVKSQEFAASPSLHFSQVAQDSLTPYWRDGKLVQCLHLLCHDVLKIIWFWLRRCRLSVHSLHTLSKGSTGVTMVLLTTLNFMMYSKVTDCTSYVKSPPGAISTRVILAAGAPVRGKQYDVMDDLLATDGLKF